jgi:hypothetical protein
MKKKDIHFTTIIAGILVMVSIVCSNVLLLSGETKQATVKTEKTDENKVQFISTPAGTVPTTFTVELNNEIYCLFEVCSGIFKSEASEPESEFQPQRYLLTLFRFIISPNAP